MQAALRVRPQRPGIEEESGWEALVLAVHSFLQASISESQTERHEHSPRDDLRSQRPTRPAPLQQKVRGVGDSGHFLSLSTNRSSEGHRSHSTHRHHRDPSNSLGSNGSSSAKKPRLDKSSNGSINVPTAAAGDAAHLDITSGDHVVAMTQLKEQLAILQKQLAKKDQELLAKDKTVGATRRLRVC